MAADQQFLLLLESARAKHVGGAVTEAIPLYEKALARAPRHPAALRLLGVAYFQRGDLQKAERLMRDAIKIAPRDAATLVNLGALYRRKKQDEKAIKSYREALAVDPRSAEAYFNLAGLYLDQKNYDAAIAAYKASIDINPNDAQTHVNLGNAYKKSARSGPTDWRLAVEAYETALRIDPKTSEAYSNLGSVYRDRVWYHASAAMLDKAIALAPGVGKLRLKRAFVVLPLGKLVEGWQDYEYRFFAEMDRIPKKPIPPPYWNGESLAGKKIFIWIEQGLGDQILFSSMIPDLISRGAHVHINATPRLRAVLERSFPDIVVLSGKPEGPVANPEHFDYQVALLSLGKFFRTRFGDFPKHRGYMKPDAGKVATFRKKYETLAAGRRIIGISWRSKNDRFGAAKSAVLTEWSSILKAPGVWFINLQYGDCGAELQDVRAKLGIDVYNDNSVDSMGDLDDFFAQVAALDLVISTSNTTVHVAGAMGVPTWLLLPRGLGSLWYWFTDRDDSPWYPSIRIFRKPHSADPARPSWHDTVEAVSRELTKTIGRWAPH